MLSPNKILIRNNVNIIGSGETTLILAHGFGCDQNMWRFLTPELSKHFTVVLFDYVGSGASDISQYSPQRYQNLEGYADDVIEICHALELTKAIFIGHSVSSIIGGIVATKQPSLIAKLVMVCPSPCFLNIPPDYRGGFEEEDLLELLNLMDKNYIGWANYLAPLVIGNAHSDELVGELSGSFCSTDPIIAKNFAAATFLSDHRDLLKNIQQPSLVFQSRNDALAAISVGEFVANEIPNSSLEIISADGHCLHMTHSDKIIGSILNYAQPQ
ncbi:alpha/beta fold hydrolase [Marinomonas sp. IMCC 4694]|uniref:alpha/beta fold hydrolase n=1 Tax=Marinomonas sp. IMCC 4694 TaxID=2605432 RepID=UPI0011E6CC0F|nr:alpha/beta hydrolase [Marinomonas sp. IMCC 4694]TYL48879.1 alpha/beta hydrolase [Marinomonas sp. IMCC 4694]